MFGFVASLLPLAQSKVTLARSSVSPQGCRLVPRKSLSTVTEEICYAVFALLLVPRGLVSVVSEAGLSMPPFPARSWSCSWVRAAYKPLLEKCVGCVAETPHKARLEIGRVWRRRRRLYWPLRLLVLRGLLKSSSLLPQPFEFFDQRLR